MTRGVDTVGIMTEEQKVFCHELILADFNPSEAARKAGYSVAYGSALLGKPHVQAYMHQLIQERSIRSRIHMDYVLKRLVDIDEMDVADLFTSEGVLKPICKWPEVFRRTIHQIEVTTTRSGDVVTKLKLPDKQKNLQMLGDHMGVRAWDKTVTIEQIAEPVQITFEVTPAVAEIKVTNHDED